MAARPRRRRARAFPPLAGLCEAKMWNPAGRVCSQKLKMNSKNLKQNSDGRRKHNNYTNTLKELAQMLPIPLRTGCKRLTKKQIIFRVLRYIEHLQSSIDTAKSLLQVNSEGSKAEEAEQAAIPVIKREQREATPPRAKKTKPLNVDKKPRKRRRACRTEQQDVSRKARMCLSLEAENIPSQVDVHREESMFAAGKEPLVLSYSQKPSTFFPSIKVLVSESQQPTDGNLGSNQQKSKEEETAFSVCAAQVVYNEQHQQELVHYNSSYEEEDEDGPRASPWLSAQSPVGITHGSLQLCSPETGAQSNNCSDLGLSPSLFSSPARLLPRHILQGGQEELSPVLFEDVYLSPQSSNFSQNLSGTLLRKSAFTLDHCYLSYNEMSKSNSSPMSRMNEIESSSWHKRFFKEVEAATLRTECPVSSSDENSDSTWVPCKRARKPSQVASQKKKKKVIRRQKCRALACEKHSSSSPLKLKKKCVNGFIMFCRLNRKHFIRAYPGMASTVATRELAQLWRVMTKQERKPYCLKARRFSLLNNRIVRDDFSSGEDELEPPKPFHLLLAEKSLPDTQFFHDLSLLELIP